MPNSPISTPPPDAESKTPPPGSTGNNSECRSLSPENSRSPRCDTPQSQSGHQSQAQTQQNQHKQRQDRLQQQQESRRSTSPVTVSNNNNNDNNNNNGDKTASTSSSSNSNNGQQQQFCLRWNNYQTNLTSVFDQLLQNESFVDVTLACDGNSIKAHKMVLSACSPYFQSLFFDNPCQHPIIIMRDVKWPELKAAVEFMYKGEINVSQEQIGPLLRVAEMLKIRGLADVKKDSELNTLPREISTSTPPVMPDATPVKKARLSHRSELEMSSFDFLSHHLSSSSSTRHNQRKRRWPSTENRSNFSSPVETVSTPDQIESTSNAATTRAATAAVTSGTSRAASPAPQNTSSSSVSRPVGSSTPIPTFPTQATLDAMGLSSLGMIHPDEMEIKPGIAEMIREEERVSFFLFCT